MTATCGWPPRCTGLDRLAASGCLRLKVMNDIALYLRAGFGPMRTVSLLTYARSWPRASHEWLRRSGL